VTAMLTPPVVRFAPSPTGSLHVGNLRGALINWLYAKSAGGSFILRMDDTDAERSTTAFADGIEADLRWLGLDWELLVRQSNRTESHNAAIDRLRAMGRIYACHETPEELTTKRGLQLAQGKPPVYDRAGLNLSDDERAKLEADGRNPHWRFLLDQEEVRWDDLIRGQVHYDAGSLSDPVVIRSDGTPLYMLPSVVDDMEMGVTHIIRGEDHVANTAEQVQIFQALDGDVPVFGHFPLLAGSEGEGLSKRLGSLALKDLRNEGFEPMALMSLVARLGTSDNIEPVADLSELVSTFDISHFSRGTAKFDPRELRRLNGKLLHDTPFDQVVARLGDLGLGEADEAFWNTVRPNLELLPDSLILWKVIHGPIKPVCDDLDFTQKAADLLPATPWDIDTWKQWTAAIKDATGAKGKALFLPLRLALTGLDHGPEMKNLLPLIGPERAKARLRGEAA
jgi:glutamyl-tRNA synthetase